MALSRRMAAPFFVVLLLVLVTAETATARDVPDEKLCLSQSHEFKGPCWINGNCDSVCKIEKFTGGKCKMDGVQGKCFCHKIC